MCRHKQKVLKAKRALQRIYIFSRPKQGCKIDDCHSWLLHWLQTSVSHQLFECEKTYKKSWAVIFISACLNVLLEINRGSMKMAD